MSSCSSEDPPRPYSAPTSFGPSGLFHSEVESDGEQTVMDIYQHRLEGTRNPRGRKPKGAYLFGIDQRLPGMSVLKGAVKISWPAQKLPQQLSGGRDVAAPLSAVASRFGAGLMDAAATHRAQRLGNKSAEQSWAARTIQKEMRRYLAVNEAQRLLIALSLRQWEMAAHPTIPTPEGFDDSQFRAECCREYEYRVQVDHYSTMILAADEIDQLNRQCPEPISDAAAALAEGGEVGEVRLLLTGSSWFRKCLLSTEDIAAVWVEAVSLLQDQSPNEVEGLNTYLSPPYVMWYLSLPPLTPPSTTTPSQQQVVAAPPASTRETSPPMPIVSAPKSLVDASKRDDLYTSQWRDADPMVRRANRRAADYSDEEGDIRGVMEDLGIELDAPAPPTSCTMGTSTMHYEEDDDPEEIEEGDVGYVASMVLGRRSQRQPIPTECIVCELDSVDVSPCGVCGAWVHTDCGVTGDGGDLRCSRLCR